LLQWKVEERRCVGIETLADLRRHAVAGHDEEADLLAGAAHLARHLGAAILTSLEERCEIDDGNSASDRRGWCREMSRGGHSGGTPTRSDDAPVAPLRRGAAFENIPACRARQHHALTKATPEPAAQSFPTFSSTLAASSPKPSSTKS